MIDIDKNIPKRNYPNILECYYYRCKAIWSKDIEDNYTGEFYIDDNTFKFNLNNVYLPISVNKPSLHIAEFTFDIEYNKIVNKNILNALIHNSSKITGSCCYIINRLCSTLEKLDKKIISVPKTANLELEERIQFYSYTINAISTDSTFGIGVTSLTNFIYAYNNHHNLPYDTPTNIETVSEWLTGNNKIIFDYLSSKVH